MRSMAPRVFVALLILFSAIGVYLELGRQDVVTDNEGQRAAPPAEMLRSGNYITPTLNGKVYLAKPPLHYWIIAGLYWASGTINEWTARIPTATCGALLVLCVYFVFRRKAGEGPARWAAIAMLTSPYFLERARSTELDVPLVLATFLTVVASYWAWTEDRPSRRALFAVLSGVALAAATLFKGPVPYLFLGASLLAFCAVEGSHPAAALRTGIRWTIIAFAVGWAQYLISWGTGHSLRFPASLVLLGLAWLAVALKHGGPALRRALPLCLLSLAVGIALCAPWAFAVLQQNGWAFVERLLHSEVIDRTHTSTAINSGSPFYYLLMLPLMVFPWGLLLPLHASREFWQEADAPYRFSVAAGWLSIAVFSQIMGKEYEYILPIVPVLLLATGCQVSKFVDGGLTGWMEQWARWCSRVLLPLLPAATLGLFVYDAVAMHSLALTLEMGLLAAAAALAVLWGRQRAEFPPMLRIAICTLLVVLAVLLPTRTFRYVGDRSPKQVALLCRDLMAAGYTVEAARVSPAFAFYAAHPIPDILEILSGQSKEQWERFATPLYGTTFTLSNEEMGQAIAAVRTKMLQPAPYFFLAQASHVLAFADLESQGVRVVAGPVTNKKLLLLGNRDPKELLK